MTTCDANGVFRIAGLPASELVLNATSDVGLPDTRLPNFDNPLQGITGGIIHAVGTPHGGAKIIYLKGKMAKDLQATLKKFLAANQQQAKTQASASVSPGAAATKEASKSVIF